MTSSDWLFLLGKTHNINFKGRLTSPYFFEINKVDKINQSELLEKLGIAAFGKTWKADLADNLPVARPTITDWMSGKKPIPVGVWSDIQRILNSRLLAIKGGILELSEQKHVIVIEEMQRKGKVVINDAFAEYLNAMSDDQIQGAVKSYKSEYAKLSKEYQNDSFADMLTIKDALDFQICVRDLNGNLDLAIAEDCAISYQNNLNLAKSFDLDEIFMIERLKEITA